MKKIINQPGDIVSQMVKGLASAHADILAQVGSVAKFPITPDLL